MDAVANATASIVHLVTRQEPFATHDGFVSHGQGRSVHVWHVRGGFGPTGMINARPELPNAPTHPLRRPVRNTAS